MTPANPDALADARAVESGRVMPIMLSEACRKQFGEKGPPVRVLNVPWELFGSSGEDWSQRNHGQSLEMIRSRGGFDATEAVCVLTGMLWQQGNSITEEQGHRILYMMRALYRRGALAAQSGSASLRAALAARSATAREGQADG